MEALRRGAARIVDAACHAWRKRPVVRSFGHAPGLWMLLTVVALVTVTVVDLSVPGTYLVMTFALGACWLVLCIIWCGWFITCLFLARSRARAASTWRRWSILPAGVVVLVVLVSTGAPIKARLALSAGPLTHAARTAADGHTPTGLHRIGLYDVSNIDSSTGVVFFTVDGTGFVDPTGFAYSPHGWPPDLHGDRYWHLFGPWYQWSEHF